MKPLLIVGLGNPLMGDDGVGAVLAESLAGRADADVLIGGTDLLRCAAQIEGRERVILIDAVIGDTPGEIIVTARDFGDFEAYLASFADNDALIKDLTKRFSFLGGSTAHFFLFGIGWNYPAQEAWAKEHFGAAEEAHWAHKHAHSHR